MSTVKPPAIARATTGIKPPATTARATAGVEPPAIARANRLQLTDIYCRKRGNH